MPTITLIERGEVLRCSAIKSPTTLQRRVADGLLPPPIRIGERKRWIAEELDAVLRARVAGASDDDVCDLVALLVAQRAGLMPDLIRSPQEGA